MTTYRPFAKKLKAVYGDEGEINVEEVAVQYIEELESNITDLNSANQAIIDIFNEHDEVRGFMRDLLEGADLMTAIARNMDADKIVPPDGDPDTEKWNKARQERLDKKKQREESTKAIIANQQESGRILSEFAEENKFSREDMKTMVSTIDPMLADLAQGKVTKEFLNILRKGLEYEKAVESTAKKTEMRVKNEKIIAKKKAAPKGDGLPHPSSGGAVPTGKQEVKPQTWVDKAFEKFDKQQF